MDLTIVILSYNVRDLLKKCLESIAAHGNYKIVVVDNASSDDSVLMIKKYFPHVKLVQSKTNTGFAKGNNLAKPFVKTRYTLFLNPDTLIKGDAINYCLKILKQEEQLGAITCKVELPDGNLDYSCHRGLPTVWNTFCYWSGLGKIFPKSALFSGYTASYLDINSSHDVDCITGAFMMIKTKILNKINWWDEDYWWNGDDVEICYKIKKAGYKIRYDPAEKIIHFKGSSSGLWKSRAMEVDKTTKVRAAKSAAKAMGIFVDKHGKELGPLPIIAIVKLGIYVIEKYRLLKINLGINYA